MRGMIKLSAALIIAGSLILMACSAAEDKLESTIYVLTDQGQGKAVGTVVVESTAEGALFRVNVKSPELLKAGTTHPFHVHEFGDLSATTDEGGNVIAGGAAGEHWDPENTGKHAGPDGDGHRGDLPLLSVNEQAEIDTEVVAKRIKNISELKGKALIIHVTDGPDRIFGAVFK